MFSCKYCKIFKNSFFYSTPSVALSGTIYKVLIDSKLIQSYFSKGVAQTPKPLPQNDKKREALLPKPILTLKYEESHKIRVFWKWKIYKRCLESRKRLSWPNNLGVKTIFKFTFSSFFTIFVIYDFSEMGIGEMGMCSS